MCLRLLSRSLIPLIILVAMTVTADEPAPFILPSAEENYSSEVAKAEMLVSKAQAIKARIVVLEREAEGDGSKSTKRPRPKETVKFGGHTYAIIREKATWHSAKQKCEEMGGHLVTFDNPKEVAFVIEVARTSGLALWLGASNDERLEQWKWVSGRIADTAGWTFNDEDRQHFSKAMIWWPETNSINDHDLGAHTAYLCEWD